jgi:cellulose synthase/poly-beta-1,6-N-acetylglucosamine synthase-like glycosyltransferase
MSATIIVALLLFWGSVAIIIYTYFGFSLLLAFRAIFRKRPVLKGSDTPSVSVIIAAHNEAGMITQKLDNVFSLDYPRENLEVIVASDGSVDETNNLVAGYGAPQLRLLVLPRLGKNHALNAGVAQAQGEILVFTDADTIMAPDALRKLVAPFSDPKVGGVGGDYRYTTNVIEGEGERTYWNYERFLKILQSAAGSMTSATGQIYAIRRGLYNLIPSGVTDDFFESSQVAAAHKRLIFEPQALAYGPVADSAEAEFRRKVRSITTGLRGVWKMRVLLNPFQYGFYSIQLLSHKVLRRLLNIPIILLFVTAPLLWHQGWFYQFATVGQFAFHAAGLMGFLLRHTRAGQIKLLMLPFYFQLVYAATSVAVYKLVTNQQRDIWAPHRPIGVSHPYATSSDGGE